jgi:hypothetical protein
MSEQTDRYQGPLLCLNVTKVDSGSLAFEYRWDVTISALDHRGHHKLAYKASGMLPDLNGRLTDFDIQVRNKDRDVWTTMPVADRKDIRGQIKSLIHEAAKTLQSCGHV